MSTTYRVTHLIGGEWTDDDTADERTNPFDPLDVVAEIAAGSPELVDRAIQVAAASQSAWGKLTGPARGAVLQGAADIVRSRVDTIARDLVREEGKTIAEATGEVRRAADILDFFGAECWRANGETLPSGVPNTLVFTRREPMGVVGLITPWNFPIAIPTWKLAPALAAGNAVVMKPAQLTTVSTMHLANALREAGLPAGVLTLVHGKGTVVGNAIVKHGLVSAVSFTGSNAVGRQIGEIAAKRGIRVQLEMGGKNPVVVLDDADPEHAADIIASGAFGLTGQACTATSRAIVTPQVYDAVVDAVISRAASFTPGDGLDPSVKMGPVVSTSQLATDESYLDIAVKEGATIAHGGQVNGLLFEPTVLTDVDPKHRIAREEVFGPVIGILRARNEDHAIELANDTEFGLSASLVSQRLSSVAKFIELSQAGVVKINRPTGGVDPNVPFGGVKESSNNAYREQGAQALDFYSWTKSVYVGSV
ncbi:aldehyde dehydrogenase family protein [Subtercola lobariae]|uniref:Aldehyde dehydrogenase n=1 Tax=Subtercola lobariae TaxID=1588641 RepID=A0A917B413_9MICO|nr:aldehyde dehydrogenase family protein [Subtercola lobariae]GGF18313.1 aldehyde dehydrogenase [Subtercola lobariae]